VPARQVARPGMAAAQPVAPVPLAATRVVPAAVALPGRAGVDLAACGAWAPRLPRHQR
jgi:hypothetical protein